MSHYILKFVGILALSAVIAVAAIFRDAFRSGEDPSDDGPRALIADFIGSCVGIALLIWSFTIQGRSLQWTLRGIAVLTVVACSLASSHFANTTEVPETPDREPTGFKNHTTSLNLED